MVDYHTHTLFSDGKENADAVINQAVRLGLKEIGISDHYTLVSRNYREVYPQRVPEKTQILKNGFATANSMNILKTENYFRILGQKKEFYKNKIKVKVSAELEYFSDNWQENVAKFRSLGADYILGGIHLLPYENSYQCLTHRPMYAEFTEEEFMSFCKKCIARNIEMINTGSCNIVAHYDLFKCFRKIKNEGELYDYYYEFAKALEKYETCLELNTDWTPVYAPDENLFVLKECGRRNIPVILSSDAHISGNICQNFSLGFKYLFECGVKYTALFDKCQKQTVEIKY